MAKEAQMRSLRIRHHHRQSSPAIFSLSCGIDGHPTSRGAARERQHETLRLREEVRQLKDRLQVLERITVDKENSVARQIEELRDR